MLSTSSLTHPIIQLLSIPKHFNCTGTLTQTEGARSQATDTLTGRRPALPEKNITFTIQTHTHTVCT